MHLCSLVAMRFLLLILTAFVSVASAAPNACENVFRSGFHPSYKDAIPSGYFAAGRSRELAKGIVTWARERESAFRSRREVAVDLMRDSQIVLFFHDRDLASIERRGFLNQYQSGHSSGWERAKDIEDGFLGLKIPEARKADEFRPKSAFLNISADVKLAEYRGVVSDRYGNIGAVMKDDVKARSLWSEQDSARVGGSYAGPWGKQLESELVAQRGTFYRGRFPRRARDGSSTVGSVPYAEAQIYGALTLADVDHFVVLKEEDGARLAPLGKPVHLVRWAVVNGRDQLIDVRVL